MSVRVSCPYCNTAFALAELPPTGRAVCPRCGDVFTVQGRTTDGPVSEPAAVPTPPAPHPPRAQKSGAVRPLLIALAFVAVGAGLLYFRGKPKPHTPEPDAPPSAAVTPPLELRGLGYLPPECNAVFAVQAGPVLVYAERTKQDPRALLAQAGVPQPVFATLDRAGVPLRQIDHIAGGIHVPDSNDFGALRAAFAVVLRRPLDDEERSLEQLKAKRTEKDGRTWYDVDAGFPMRLARAADTVWVFGLSEKDFAAAWAGGTAVRTAGLREVIAGQVPVDAVGWLATESAPWTEKPLIKTGLTFTAWKPEQVAVLAKGRAAAVGVVLGDAPRLHAAVRCADAAAAEQLRAYFRGKGTAGGAGEWATLDRPGSPQEGFQAIKDMLTDAK